MNQARHISPWLQGHCDKLDKIADDRYLIKVSSGNILFVQEESNTDVFIVKSGRVRLSFFTEEGEEKIFMFALPGSMFGEVAAFDSSAQFFQAVTIVPCELYKIPIAVFLDMISGDVALAIAAFESMAYKHHVLVEHIRRVSFLDAKSQIAAVFVDLAHVFGVEDDSGIRIDLPVIQQGIANLIRTSRPTVGKAIREFNRGGIIQKKDNRFYIYKLDELKKLSGIR